MIYLCSDTHLRHDNVLKFDKKRGDRFGTIEDHDRRILDQWQSLTPKDEVYFLGDLVRKMDSETEEWLNKELSKVKAKIFFISGNHDYDRIVEKYEHNFERVKDYYKLKYQKTKFILCHYPIQDWDGRFKGAIHIHGHQHAPTIRGYTRDRNRYDISFNGGKFLYSIDDFISIDEDNGHHPPILDFLHKDG